MGPSNETLTDFYLGEAKNDGWFNGTFINFISESFLVTHILSQQVFIRSGAYDFGCLALLLLAVEEVCLLVSRCMLGLFLEHVMRRCIAYLCYLPGRNVFHHNGTSLINQS